MEKATSSIRRGGTLLWSIGAGYPELNLIITELKNLRSHIKAVRDSQQTVLQDMTNWACNDESRALKELFVHLLDLNAQWCEVQTQFADHINEFKHQFEMILEGEKSINAARDKFAYCEFVEQKARKKLKKIQKKEVSGDIAAITSKIAECERQREIAQTEVSQKVQENEAIKLIRVKEGLLKLSEAYLALSHKCIYIFEAQRDITKCLPDVEDREIHEVRFDGLMGAKEIMARARDRVKDYRSGSNTNVSSPQQRNVDPPPPYSPSPYFPSPPFNPYYVPPGNQGSEHNRESANSNSVNDPPNAPSSVQPNAPPNAPSSTQPNAPPNAPSSTQPNAPPNTLYPDVTSEELVGAMSSAIL